MSGGPATRAAPFTLLALLALVACGPGDPCRSQQFERLARSSLRYAGHWRVASGDTLTLPDAPEIADRFRLTDVILDTTTVVVRRECVFRGRLVFSVPRAETLAVAWFGQPERMYVMGWPADLGPFGGLGLAFSGRDSLLGAVLFDEKLGVRLRPGVTAQFVAGRVEPTH